MLDEIDILFPFGISVDISGDGNKEEDVENLSLQELQKLVRDLLERVAKLECYHARF